MNILYIHGFGSTGDSEKSKSLREMFPNSTVFSPDVPIEPQEALLFLRQFVFDNKIDLIVGSSLGGFYAHVIASRNDIPVILINPSVFPWETLESKIGINANFDTQEKFEWKPEYLDQLLEINKQISIDPLWFFYLVLVGMKDEVIHVNPTLDYFRHADIIKDPNRGHSFEGFTEFDGNIKEFIKKVGLC